jgi:hypothetical protein
VFNGRGDEVVDFAKSNSCRGTRLGDGNHRARGGTRMMVEAAVGSLPRHGRHMALPTIAQNCAIAIHARRNTGHGHSLFAQRNYINAWAQQWNSASCDNSSASSPPSPWPSSRSRLRAHNPGCRQVRC